jgi:hypothetical protein
MMHKVLAAGGLTGAELASIAGNQVPSHEAYTRQTPSPVHGEGACDVRRLGDLNPGWA